MSKTEQLVHALYYRETSENNKTCCCPAMEECSSCIKVLYEEPMLYLPGNHRSKLVVEEILAYGNGLLSALYREFTYLKLSRPTFFIKTTQ